jgi:hypothetical protein
VQQVVDATVAKETSEAITVALAIIGLVSDFKDKQTNKLTRAGKWTLAGLLVSFGVSGLITALEYQNGRAQQAAHDKEVRRLLQPLGNFTTEIVVKLNDKDVAEQIRKSYGWSPNRRSPYVLHTSELQPHLVRQSPAKWLHSRLRRPAAPSG